MQALLDRFASHRAFIASSGYDYPIPSEEALKQLPISWLEQMIVSIDKDILELKERHKANLSKRTDEMQVRLVYTVAALLYEAACTRGGIDIHGFALECIKDDVKTWQDAVSSFFNNNLKYLARIMASWSAPQQKAEPSKEEPQQKSDPAIVSLFTSMCPAASQLGPEAVGKCPINIPAFFREANNVLKSQTIKSHIGEFIKSPKGSVLIREIHQCRGDYGKAICLILDNDEAREIIKSMMRSVFNAPDVCRTKKCPVNHSESPIQAMNDPSCSANEQTVEEKKEEEKKMDEEEKKEEKKEEGLWSADLEAMIEKIPEQLRVAFRDKMVTITTESETFSEHINPVVHAITDVLMNSEGTTSVNSEIGGFLRDLGNGRAARKPTYNE